MILLEIILVFVSLIISFFYIKTKKEKIITIFLILISFLGLLLGYILTKAFIMDAINPDKQIHLGNIIMIFFSIIQVLIFIKLIIDFFKK